MLIKSFGKVFICLFIFMQIFLPLTVVYAENSTKGTIDVYCYDEAGNIIGFYPNSAMGDVGVDYTMRAPEVGGYELDTSKLPTNESGQYTDGFIQVSYYYKKKLAEGIVDAYCFDESGNIIAEYPNSATGVVGSTYTVSAPEVSGYELDTSKLPANESGQYDEGFIQVSYYYKKKLTEGIVDVYCFDESGNIIAEYPNSATGVVGSTYTVSASEVSGYELDTSKLPANESGQYDEGFIQVSYYYKKKMISDIIKKNSNENSINNSKNSNVLKNEQPKKILENRIIPKMGEETNFSYIFLGVMMLLSLSFYYRKDKDTK